ncbi:hypothetical protein BU26DRAFT_568348 [Trematosphaeria pertusa]|uniref:Uncharacterized protein n=1 Tax=Trematosphaeria pertusa TaxID=390896 RepID=A0A6A6I434_9PLEO|nr:uncharacterized protein BU26DRAFT_568348 [Trematosphaeria pertusa]KAF2245046.1 hypothetical protein BU26DRAFT_568348 [Trematosphaeria pertusa]
MSNDQSNTSAPPSAPPNTPQPSQPQPSGEQGSVPQINGEPNHGNDGTENSSQDDISGAASADMSHHWDLATDGSVLEPHDTPVEEPHDTPTEPREQGPDGSN